MDPVQGSCDFFFEASALLRDSDTPHVLLAGLSGHSFKLTSWNVTKESFPWFRREMETFLDRLEGELES